MSKLIVVYGNVSSGKSTLCRNLRQLFPYAKYWSSDGIRFELSGDLGGKSRGMVNGKMFDTFATMAERVGKAMREDGIVIVDSTGMSKDFVNMVNMWRDIYSDVTVCRLYCDYDTWQAREAIRTDRLTKDKDGNQTTFVMPKRAYLESSETSFKEAPDFEICTSALSPEEVVIEFYNQLTNTR